MERRQTLASGQMPGQPHAYMLCHRASSYNVVALCPSPVARAGQTCRGPCGTARHLARCRVCSAWLCVWESLLIALPLAFTPLRHFVHFLLEHVIFRERCQATSAASSCRCQSPSRRRRPAAPSQAKQALWDARMPVVWPKSPKQAYPDRQMPGAQSIPDVFHAGSLSTLTTLQVRLFSYMCYMMLHVSSESLEDSTENGCQ